VVAVISRALALALCSCLLACGADREPSTKTSKAEPPPLEPAVEVQGKAPSEQPAKPVPAETPAGPRFDSLLGGRFALAAAGLAHAPTDPREHGPSWQLPACELEYQFRVHIGDGLRGSPVTVISGSWTARAAASEMILKNGEIRLAHMSGAAPRSGESVRAGKLAEVRLKLNYREWMEVDGPTALWGAYGSWSGLSKFYPAVPELGGPGSPATWHLQLHERKGSGAVEGRRGSLEVPDGVALPEPETIFRNPDVTVERWIELEDHPAVVLRSWSEVDDANTKMAEDALKVREIGQGRFVVLDSGVLLHAELREHSEFEILDTRTELAIEAEARLVRGCGGPVLPRMDDLPSAPERALEAVAQLRDLARAGEREQLSAMLHDELRTAEPEAATCLIDAIERHGVESFGAPKLPLGQAVREGKGRVALELPARTSPNDRSSSAGYVFVSDAATGVLTLATIELRRGAEVLLHLEPGQPRIGCEAPVDR
jgi:hypothetical protein